MPNYKDDDFVYVDPRTREVKGLVEWTKDGNAKPLIMEFIEKKKDTEAPEGADKKPKKLRKPRKQYYPWGSYKTMKKLYKLEGKEKEAEKNQTLDTAIEKSLKQPFWD
jgi:hypothetical protein